jgi:NAD(P)-dependent dehydrogenase (short-subunit alcohol dehydrogenase family)
MLSVKVAVVTGGGSGIGRAVALALGREGYAVVVAGRRHEALAETSSLGRQVGLEITTVPTDVTSVSGVHRLFLTTAERHGRLDLLFNNAGTTAPARSVEDLEYDQWRTVLDTNLTGAFLCTQEAFRLMKKQMPPGGRIINNGSISAHAPRPGSAAYTAAKHAITGLTKATSLDGRRYDIACGQIDIGNAATELTDRFAEGTEQPNGETTVEPRIDVDDVARAVIYMASLPLTANVLFMTVMATKMPFVGRG